MFVPYDNIAHAGGKTYNYYLKYLNSLNDYQVKLISFCEEKEKHKLDLEKYKIDSHIINIDSRYTDKIMRLILNIESKFNVLNRNANFISNYHAYKVIQTLRILKNQNYTPELIILEWTQMVLLVSQIKKMFPNSKIIASEHDVSYVGLERKYKLEKNHIFKFLKHLKYTRLYNAENTALKKCDLIITHNNKDLELLADLSFSRDKLFSIVPFYTEAVPLKYNKESKKIVFFGAMGRPENYLSVIWFIENVFWKINDPDVKLYIVGGNPHDSLFKFSSERIVITGFIDDVNTYFSDCICSVAPLILGAGIKVKVLEAMAAGVVVLTNQIGIEGIFAQKESDYIHCESPDDYVKAIADIIADRSIAEKISLNARNFVRRNFNLSKSKTELANRLQELSLK